MVESGRSGQYALIVDAIHVRTNNAETHTHWVNHSSDCLKLATSDTVNQ